MVKRSKYKEVLSPELLAEELTKLNLSDIARKYKLGVEKVKLRAYECGLDINTRDDVLKLRPKEELYRPLENYDISFFLQEVKDFREMWKAGINIIDIAAKMKRDEIAIGVLVVDQGAKSKIEPRKNGAYGDLTYEEKACIFCGEITNIKHFNKRVCKSCIETLQSEVQDGEEKERTHHPGTDTRED